MVTELAMISKPKESPFLPVRKRGSKTESNSKYDYKY